MGLFSFLKKKSVFTDNVCVNEEAKRKNMIKALMESLSGGRITIVTYHFRNNSDTVTEWLEKEKIPFREEIDAYWLYGLTTASDEVHLTRANDLSGRARNAAPVMQTEIEVHLMEHYPLPAKDDLILSLAAMVTNPIRFIAWSSLDEPLMKVFGGDRITGMMKQLGMNENEIISHPFVAKAIRSAQEKIAKIVKVDSECRSSEEWFSMNIQSQMHHDS